MTNFNRQNTFMEMLNIETQECIVWPYAKGSHGYGQLWYNGKDTSVHRIALIIKKGEPKNRKLHALHKPNVCHNRLCFNYKHLYWGNHRDNRSDAVKDGTATMPPTFIGEKHPMARLTKDEVINIRKDEDSHRKIAAKYSISKSTVTAIKNRRIWKELK